MSSGQLARNRTLSLGSGRSSKGRQASLADFSMPQTNLARDFEPCDATASMFLYAQGSAIICVHHDTLTIERRFTRHTEQVQLLAVDNVSERGAGRLVISYDAGQTAIVWDLMTGDEIARFASYNNLSVAAWMRNGNVAFGNAQGNVILFEPTTSEHISARTIDQVPITAIAPGADCRTYAIGYQNGSLLICILQPRFTILHNLTTSRGPSPIVTLAWHASSSKQKSDMLAAQTQDGDLRVWSVAKNSNSNETAKVVRVLKRSDLYQDGPNWLAWSKNGRIIQYSNGETASWDVRTKNVTYENVPTLEHVRGITVYGPGATLFTLGRSNTAQQFDLNSPPVLVANVQHPANFLPPSPPVSIEEQNKGIVTMRADGLSSIPINVDLVSESDEEHMSPLARIAREMDKLEERQYMPNRSDALSPVSSQASLTSRSSAASHTRAAQKSVRSRGMSERTIMSIGSSLHSREPSIVSSRDSMSVGSLSTSSNRSLPRSSRLRHEVVRSPDDKVIVQLFKFTKSRLSDIPYRAPQIPDGRNRTVQELRRQMLSTIFGWDGEAEGLIRDELSRHTRGSPSCLLLTKWLGDIDTDIMATSSHSMTSSDWMLLALSGIGGPASQQKVARAYVQRLLEKGDVHTAATIMIGMGDQHDAIEIYVSHRRYMEALILTSYVYPADWGRQSQLIRKWGEWAVQHSQQQLAIRCFSCTSSEPAEPSISPVQQVVTSFPPRAQNVPEILSPPLSPPGVVPRGPQRNMAKTAALKLVTTFGDSKTKSKFFGNDGNRTPINGVGVTPIAESALSPGGGDQTAFLRNQRSIFNTPASATRTATPGGFSRARLPSIGEMPTDVITIVKEGVPSLFGGSESENSISGRSGRGHQRKSSQPETQQLNSEGQARSATASPMLQRAMQGKAANPLPSPSPDSFTGEKAKSRARNSSRDKKPADLQIQAWPAMESILTGDYMITPELSANSSKHRTPKARSASGSVAGSASSISVSERSHRSYGVASPVTGRSIDQYISSLEVAQYAQYKQRSRQTSREPQDDPSKRGNSATRGRAHQEASEERGRSGARLVKPAKRSPTSPVPMSPDEFRGAGAAGFNEDRSESASAKRRVRDTSSTTIKPSSRTTSRRRTSPEPVKTQQDSRPASRATARMVSRKASPEPPLASRDGRGRSKGRDGSVVRSPSSPLPMSPDGKLHHAGPATGDDAKPAPADRERHNKSRQRSASRAKERGTSSGRQASPERKRRENEGQDEPQQAPRSTSHQRPVAHQRSASDLKAGDLHQIKLDRLQKREAAAKELEDRRRSLAQRPSAPPILHPEQIPPVPSRPSSSNRGSAQPTAQLPPRSFTVSPESTRSQQSNKSSSSSVQVGLPATPRAMQHPKFDPDNKDIPDVPQIPEGYSSASQVMVGGPSGITSIEGSDVGTLPMTTFPLLPKTTYQAATRHVPPRSMSAPIQEKQLPQYAVPSGLPTHPAFQAALPPSSRRRNHDAAEEKPLPISRHGSTGESQPGIIGYEARHSGSVSHSSIPVVLGGIDETIQANKPKDQPNSPVPPPPPASVPPILKELQHLAMPPPPPPAPLYRAVPTNQNVDSGATPAAVEIVDEDAPAPPRKTPPQVLEVAQGHSRGRSQNDNSIGGRISRATDRIRSASRGASPQLSRTKSPTVSSPSSQQAPYESIPTARWVADQEKHRSTYSHLVAVPASTERHPRDVKADMVEGGMI